MDKPVFARADFPPVLFQFAEPLLAAGKRVFLVGGTLRDRALGLPARFDGDIDIATDARPREVQSLYRKTVPTGIQHGTVTVLFRGHEFEVTTFRADGTYSDGRHPDEVAFSDTIEEDLARRDFTVNALALDLATCELADPFGGLVDLERRVIRAVGDPVARFGEDGLRCLRACRFAGRLDFTIEPATLAAIPGSLDTFRRVAAERVRDELVKIMEAARPSRALEYMRVAGLLEAVLPELAEGYGVEQNEYHVHDVYRHNLYSCDAAAAAGEPWLIRLAALLHDVGKVRALANARKRDAVPEGETVFYNHETIGARMADRVLRRLKFSNNEREHVVHLIRHHMFHYTDEWTDGAVRRLMRNVGVENLDDLFRLRRADRLGNGKKQGQSRSLPKLQQRIDMIIAAANAITVKDLKVNGNDLMTELALRPGPVIGVLLERLLEAILDDPARNERDELLALAREYLKELPLARPEAPAASEAR